MFYLKITVPTTLSNSHSTLIDNFFCNLTENTVDTTPGVLINKSSDHQPYFILLNNIITKESPPVYVKVTKRKLKTHVMENPNNTYNILQTVIQDAKKQTHALKISKI